jgi:YesN/AraC family two-component response regulator
MMNTAHPEDLAAHIAQAAASASGEPATAVAPAGASHRCDVLIVDDTGTSRELLAAILRNFAGRLVLREARNGADALQIWHESNPRVTLLDIDMPDMDGLAVLKSMRQVRADTFVAMISGTNSIDHVRDALALGASGFVVKPYKPRRILDLLDKYGEQSGHPLTG